MKRALQNIKPSTSEFLKKKFIQIHNSQEANQFLVQYCGIETFFRTESEFQVFLNTLTLPQMVCEKSDRREYGDFQTPSKLSDLICQFLYEEGLSPQLIIEPTFGKGAFIISALKLFPKVDQILGVEIHEPYFWQAKFSTLELFIDNPDVNKPQIALHCDDVFKFDFNLIRKAIDKQNILVLGNPPWVTNSELSSLNSSNLPTKSNFKSYNGFEAITGKGNFDIGEYIILMMLNAFAECNGYIAMLAKNSVIKNILQDLSKTNYKISDLTAINFDAKLFFNASVDAALFKCRLGVKTNRFICKVSALDTPKSIDNEFGWIGNKFVSNVTLYKKIQAFDGVSPLIWRQGVKHDCSKILEIDLIDSKYVNGFNEQISLEDDLIFGLAKSSDLQANLVDKPRKYLIVTQKRIGQDTHYISEKFPKLYKYLCDNIHFFLERKSNIYKGKAQFAIFGIGEYSFKLYKVAISGLYKKPHFSLILPFNNKPMMLDDTCYFLGFDKLSEALITLAILNSKYVQKLLHAITFIDAKRPYTKDILMRIDLIKVGEHLGFDNSINLLNNLPNDIVNTLNRQTWNEFFTKYKSKELAELQYSLFELK